MVLHRNATLVFAIGWGYPLNVYRNYVESLRNTGYAGDVMLILSGDVAPDVVQLCESLRTKIMKIDRETLGRGADPKRRPNPSIQRFRLYEQVCEPRYTFCIGTDLRDVFWQKDPARKLLQRASEFPR